MNLSEDYFQRKQKLFWRRILIATVGAVLISVTLFSFLLTSKAVVIKVVPDEAAVSAKQELDGFGFVFSDNVYLLGRKVTLMVSADGFVPQAVEIIRDMSKRNIVVALEQAQSQIQAQASPPDEGIRWKLDDKVIGTGAVLVADSEPGTRTLEVSHPYYETQTASLELKRGAKTELTFTLAPVRGEIKVSSQPQPAQVILDGETVGETPLKIERPGGVYRVEIGGNDFTLLNDQVEVTATHPAVNRDYRLAYKKAHVTLSLSPPDGQLLINGKLATTTAELEIEPLNETVFLYSKAGYPSQKTKKTFKPDQSAIVSFSLTPTFGEVRISAVPIVEIALNGKAIGFTPKTLNLRTVPHTVTLSKKGYRSVSKKFTPTSRRITKISETLQTEFEARLAESPAKAKNSIGVELVLIDPRRAPMPFTIGAPRSEKGQRANEFLRTAHITKPFYVGSKEISISQYSQSQNQNLISNLPITNITWDEAAGFCNWLSNKEKLTPFYRISGGRVTGFLPVADGYRLLSEAEWEWLARYAERPQGVKFIWGNDTTIPKQAANLADESAKNANSNIGTYIPNYNDGYPQAAPVGSLMPDKAGLYDMAGNVSEWVNDVYTLEQTAAVMKNPLGPQAGSEHVVKGSSWRSGTLSSLRSSFRAGLSGKRDDLGFRIARYIYGAIPNE